MTVNWTVGRSDQGLGRFGLDGRTALITGGGGLLGYEHAAALLELGARVVLADVDYEALLDAQARLSEIRSGNDVLVERMDVRDPSSIVAVADRFEEDGGIGVLVNNAALNPKVDDAGIASGSRLETFSLDRWNDELAVGLTGAFLCSQVFGSRMAEAGGGVILNISSDLAVMGPDQRLYRRDGVPDSLQPVKPVSYSVLKAGLVGLTRYLATYWPDQGVRANAISPGGVWVDQSPEFVDRLESRIPLGRMAAPDEYRAAVQFLCSDASAYMTGQNIVMDGGRSVW